MADKFASFEANFKGGKKLLSSLIKNSQEIEKRNKKYLKLMSTLAFRDFVLHFRNEEGPKEPWDDWSQVYADQMAAKKPSKAGNKILQDTGNLRQNLIPTNVVGTRKGILFFNPAKTKDGFPYAKAHDEGGPQLPKRKFMWLSKSAIQDMSKQTLKFMTKKK